MLCDFVAGGGWGSKICPSQGGKSPEVRAQVRSAMPTFELVVKFDCNF